MLRAYIQDVAGGYGTIGNAAIWQKVAAYRLTGLVVPGPQASAFDCGYVHGRGLDFGVMRVPGWTPGVSPQTYASLMHGDVSRALGSPTAVGQCVAIADAEIHDPQWVLDWLRAWRKVRPTRATVWTMEPHQAGWMTATLTNPDGSKVRLVDAVNADPHLTLAPQMYGGDMSPFSADAMVLDLLDHGVHRDHVSAFYDGARPAAYWDGYVFTLDRLPSPSLLHHPMRLLGKARARLGLDELARSA
jgi:hypothetical protein